MKNSPDLGWASQHCGTKIGHEMSPKYQSNFWPREITGKQNISCYVSKGCHSHHRFQPSRALSWEKNTCVIWQESGCSHLLLGALRNSEGENTDKWPQRAEMHMKGMIPVSPDSCLFPYIEKGKVPNTWFSLLHKNTFWCSDCLPFVSNFCVTWLSAPPTCPHLLGAVLSGLFEMLSPGLEVLKIPTE